MKDFRCRYGFELCRYCVWSRFERETRYCHRVFFPISDIGVESRCRRLYLLHTAPLCILRSTHDHQTVFRFFHLRTPHGCPVILLRFPIPPSLPSAVFLKLPRLVKLSVSGNRSFLVKRLRLPHSSTRSGSSIQIPDGIVPEKLKMHLVENEEGEAEVNLAFPVPFLV